MINSRNRDADVEFASEKYPKWEACAPCEPGSFKDHSGNLGPFSSAFYFGLGFRV